jgi:ribosomal protein S27E
MPDLTCETCGSEYSVMTFKSIARDRDSLDCEVCGGVLIAWNGGTMYYNQRLTKRGVWPRADQESESKK